MTQEIIEMAREAGVHTYPKWAHGVPISALEAFAKLVADKAVAAEREAFAVHAVDIARRAVAEEREACAQVCEGLNLYGGDEYRQLQRATLKDCAYAIRARGQE